MEQVDGICRKTTRSASAVANPASRYSQILPCAFGTSDDTATHGMTLTRGSLGTLEGRTKRSILQRRTSSRRFRSRIRPLIPHPHRTAERPKARSRRSSGSEMGRVAPSHSFFNRTSSAGSERAARADCRVAQHFEIFEIRRPQRRCPGRRRMTRFRELHSRRALLR